MRCNGTDAAQPDRLGTAGFTALSAGNGEEGVEEWRTVRTYW
jgi:hypothetical protein